MLRRAPHAAEIAEEKERRLSKRRTHDRAWCAVNRTEAGLMHRETIAREGATARAK